MYSSKTYFVLTHLEDKFEKLAKEMSRKIKFFIKHTFRLSDDLEADFALVYIRARILRLS